MKRPAPHAFQNLRAVPTSAPAADCRAEGRAGGATLRLGRQMGTVALAIALVSGGVGRIVSAIAGPAAVYAAALPAAPAAPVGQTDVALTTDGPVSSALGTTFTVTVQVQPNRVTPDAAAAYLTYSADSLEFVGLTTGSTDDTEIYRSIDTPGIVYYAAARLGDPWPSSTFTLAQLTFRVKATPPARLTFTLLAPTSANPNRTEVAAAGVSVLAATQPLTVSFISPTATPTAAVSPTPVPAGTATVTAPAGTPRATGTAAATVTVASTPSVVADLTPSPTSTPVKTPTPAATPIPTWTPAPTATSLAGALAEAASTNNASAGASSGGSNSAGGSASRGAPVASSSGGSGGTAADQTKATSPGAAEATVVQDIAAGASESGSPSSGVLPNRGRPVLLELPAGSLPPLPAAVQVGVATVAPAFRDFYAQRQGLRVLGNTLALPHLENGLTVQYFEKGRLEDHDSETNAAWRLQYGLLVDELASAQATLPVGGDASSVTYATIHLLTQPEARVPAPPDFIGGTTILPDGAVFVPFSAELRPGPGQVVPANFWSYINDEQLFPGGWLHDVGLPITAPVEAVVDKGQAKGRHIVVQAFQRTILTFDPLNPLDYQVERANVGTDYARIFPDRFNS